MPDNKLIVFLRPLVARGQGLIAVIKPGSNAISHGIAAVIRKIIRLCSV